MRQNTRFPPARRQPKPESEPPPSRQDLLRRRFRAALTRFHSAFLVGASVLATLVALFLFNTANPPPRPPTQRDVNAAVARAMASATPAPSYESQVYEAIRPSLVRVQTSGANPGTASEIGIGAGVVVDESGTIMTNLHVVAGADHVTVTFADGTESPAQTVATQPENDLAILRPSTIPDDLVPATLGSSSGLRVGDQVVAVGNPFGISSSLSAGVVSGLGREFRSPSTGQRLTRLIQFDAAVNPGNSGGPLLDRDGEVVGIVTGLMNPTGQNVFIGIGFAVPIESAASALGSPPY